jgi:hypothetical protein
MVLFWTGDLEDDCKAHWRGMCLRAEAMDEGVWWWAVYDDVKSDDASGMPVLEVISVWSSDDGVRPRTGEQARRAAATAAARYLRDLYGDDLD